MAVVVDVSGRPNAKAEQPILLRVVSLPDGRGGKALLRAEVDVGAPLVNGIVVVRPRADDDVVVGVAVHVACRGDRDAEIRTGLPPVHAPRG